MRGTYTGESNKLKSLGISYDTAHGEWDPLEQRTNWSLGDLLDLLPVELPLSLNNSAYFQMIREYSIDNDEFLIRFQYIDRRKDSVVLMTQGSDEVECGVLMIQKLIASGRISPIDMNKKARTIQQL